MLKTILTTYLLLIPCVACDDSPASNDNTQSSVDPTNSDSNVNCCPLEEPSCDAPFIGGSLPASGQVEDCERAPWDAAPIDEDWNVGADENGCPIYTSVSEESCISAPADDAGPDAATTTQSPEAGPDAAPTGQSPEAGPDAAIVCCPIEEPSCDAPLRGGRAPASGSLEDCERVPFDVAPVAADWVVATDEFGCDTYESVSESSCLEVSDGGTL